MEDLEEVIMYHREVLTLHPLGHSDHSSSLENLANVVLTCYKKLGRMKDLEEVITFNREALSICSLGHPSLISINNLASSAVFAFWHTGPNCSACLNNLANAILACYKQLGSMADLEEVITYYHEVLTLCPPGHPE